MFASSTLHGLFFFETVMYSAWSCASNSACMVLYLFFHGAVPAWCCSFFFHGSIVFLLLLIEIVAQMFPKLAWLLPARLIFFCASNLISFPKHAGSNGKKRRFYSDDLKISIYLELLAKTDPPVLHRGVSKAVARKFGVPVQLVQSVWRNGQDYGGIKGVINKLVNN